MPKISPAYEGNTFGLKISIVNTQTGQSVLEGLSPENLIANNLASNIVSSVYNRLNDLFVLYNPTVNSYKRLKENKFEKWKKNQFKPGFYENFVGLTVLKENNQNKLLLNISGSDLNPYLALFAFTSSINEGLQLKPDFSESLKSFEEKGLPTNLLSAVNNFETSEFTKKLLGDEIHYHFSHFYNYEYAVIRN